MKLLSLEFKNIGSYGDIVHKVEFDSGSSDLILIQGKNGNGKSTIAKALKFVLFGKVDGITLKDIPNRINKNAWGRVTLIAKNTKIVVERGYAPGLFNLLIENSKGELEPFDKAGNRNVQNYLEEEFLGFNFSVFTNILILSVNDFKSFLTMKPSDKRKIIDKIFGFNIINEMREKVKSEKKQLRLNLARIEEALVQIDSTIKHTNEKIEALKEKSDQANRDKALELKAEIEKINVEKEALTEKYKLLNERVSNIRLSRSTETDKIAELKEKNKTLQKTLALYENSACPTCQSPLDTPFHIEIIEKTKSDIESIKVEAIAHKEKMETLTADLTKAQSFEKKLIKNIQELKSSIASKKNEIQAFINSNKDNDAELQSLIVEFEEKQQTKTEELDLNIEEETFLNVLEEDILSDEGIKSLAIRAVVPVLNKTIEKFSNELNSQFNIEFDQNFNCILKHLGEEINAGTLSEGERKKADLIIIIAMIEILKLRYPNMNLLFLDELFSSLDQENITKILDVLKHMLESLHINIFVISHTELPVQMFDKIVHVYKKGPFSQFNVHTDLSQVPDESSDDK